MGHFCQNLLSTALAAFGIIPAQAGLDLSNHPVYLAWEGATGVTTNFEVMGSI